MELPQLPVCFKATPYLSIRKRGVCMFTYFVKRQLSCSLAFSLLLQNGTLVPEQLYYSPFQKAIALSLGFAKYLPSPHICFYLFCSCFSAEMHAHQLSLLLNNQRMTELLCTLVNAGSQAPLPSSSQGEVQHSTLCKRRTLGRLAMTIKKHKGVTGS